MANRMFTNQALTLEKEVVKLFARATIGASGAPTLVTSQSKGITSITRNSAGNYTLVLGTSAASLDTYVKLLGVSVTNDTSGASGAAAAAPLIALTANATATAGTASLTLQMRNTSGTATDPASGEALLIEITLGNSTAL